MRVAFDTSVLAYAGGIDDALRQKRAVDLARRLPREHGFIPVQVLGELYRVLIWKGKFSPAKANDEIRGWGKRFFLIETSGTVLFAAADLAANHRLQIWDSIVLAAAADAGCALLLSEDMQHGFAWSGVTVVNPFLKSTHPLLEAALGHMD